jgi:regulator of protease activity HflC (stomatin/prohibitin superfamily)
VGRALQAERAPDGRPPAPTIQIEVGKMRSSFALLAAALVVAGCTSVDTTEHCVLTRYGRVIEPRMSTGLNFTPLAKATCFSMTDKNFPDQGAKETMEAQTRDPITVVGDVGIVYSYDPATILKLFEDKRTPEAAEAEILNAVREGYRNALASWTVSQIFSADRASLSDSVRSHIQRKLGGRAVVKQVFVRDIKAPAAIEAARIEAAKQAQVLDRAIKQFQIDSVNARATVIGAEAQATAKRLEAQAYAQNRELLQLRIAEAQAKGLSEACKGVQTCVIGGSVLDSWKSPR